MRSRTRKVYSLSNRPATLRWLRPKSKFLERSPQFGKGFISRVGTSAIRSRADFIHRRNALLRSIKVFERMGSIRRIRPDAFFGSSLRKKLVCGRRQIRKEVLNAFGIAGGKVRRGSGGGNPEIRCR